MACQTLVKLAGFVVAQLAIGCGSPPMKPSSWTSEARGISGSTKVAIFVHGVMGDAESTWKACECGPGWPEFFGDDPKLTDYDVFVFSYYSPAFAQALSIQDVASQLILDLEQAEILLLNSRYRDGIVFIAHSMGSLVVREALLDKSWDDYGLHVPLVVSFAPPNGGSHYADLVRPLSNNKQFSDLAASGSFTKTLDRHWQEERDQRTKVACAYETRAYPGLGEVIVDWADVTAGNQSFVALQSFDEDHSSIVKPRGLFDRVHLWTRKMILENP